MKKLSARLWLTLILIGLVGQFAWTIENMYFNVFLYNTISTDPGYISAMVGWSAAAATLTTLLMGALSDRVGKRKLFICGGYLLWGVSTAAFGFVTVEGYSTFPLAQQSIFSDAAQLTDTELAILRLVCETKTRKEIATELYLSEGTVKRHISEILAKTGYDNILRLAVHAVSTGLIVPSMTKGANGE